jgi:hypothetical protein
MARVYAYLSMGVAVSILAAYGAGLAGIYLLIYLTPLFWIVIAAPFVLAVASSLAVNRMSAATAHLLFWLYAVFVGLSFAGIFLAYSGQDVAIALGAVALIFIAASAYGYSTRRDSHRAARYLLLGLLVVVAAGVAAAFADSGALTIAVAVAAAAVMGGLVACDTQHTRQRLELASKQDAAEVERVTIMGALTLYLDLVIFSPGLARLAGFATSRAADLGRLAPLIADEAEHRGSE